MRSSDAVAVGDYHLKNIVVHAFTGRPRGTDIAVAPGWTVDQVLGLAASADQLSPHILAAAGRAGYRTSLSFDVDPADYTDPGPAAVVARVLAAVGNGSIVSLHLGHAGTVTALPAILAGLAARSLRPVTVTQLLI